MCGGACEEEAVLRATGLRKGQRVAVLQVAGIRLTAVFLGLFGALSVLWVLTRESPDEADEFLLISGLAFVLCAGVAVYYGWFRRDPPAS